MRGRGGDTIYEVENGGLEIYEIIVTFLILRLLFRKLKGGGAS